MHEKEGEINIPDEEKWSLGRKKLLGKKFEVREREVLGGKESTKVERDREK